MRILNIGGGFGGIGDISDDIYEILKITKNDPLGYEVISEPGRFLSSNCY